MMFCAVQAGAVKTVHEPEADVSIKANSPVPAPFVENNQDVSMLFSRLPTVTVVPEEVAATTSL